MDKEKVYLVVRHEEFVGFCIEEGYSKVFSNFDDALTYAHELNNQELFDDDFYIMSFPLIE